VEQTLRTFSALVAGGLATLGFLACVGSDSTANPETPANDASAIDSGTPGDEGSACFANNTCNAGLTCASNRCVRLPDGGDGTPNDAALDPPDGCAVGTCDSDKTCPKFLVDHTRNLAYDTDRQTTWMSTPYTLQTWSEAVADCASYGVGWSLPDSDSLKNAMSDDSPTGPTPGCAFTHPSMNPEWTNSADGAGMHDTVAPNANLTHEADTTKRNVRCIWRKP
jgi:hypothetical protein